MKIPSFQYAQLRKAYRRFYPKIDIQNRKTASYFALTFALFSLSFFGIFAIRPTLTTATSLVKSVADLKQLNMDYENKIGSLIRSQSEYEKLRDDLPLLDYALPNNSNFSSLAKTVERFAQQENVFLTQLAIDSVPISTPASSSKLNQYGFTIIGTGEYSSLSALISHLLNWQRIVTIKSLDFSQEGSSPSGILRLTLKALTYYEP